MKTIADLAASKLHPDEEQLIRDAADALLFCEDVLADPDAQALLDGVRDLARRLVEGDRVLPETADRLVADVEGCGPLECVSA